MNKNDYPLKQKIKCPICNSEFIPESFNVEKLDIDQSLNLGEIYRSDETDSKSKIKPLTIMRRAWVTYCLDCNHAIRFAAEILRKEIVEKPSNSPNSGEFKESSNTYKYNIYTFKKPFMELIDYRIGVMDRIKNDIKTTLDELRISEWGAKYNAWKNEKTIDSFKFFTQFISNLDNHYKSIFKNDINKDMPEKIRELNLPKDLENLLLEVNRIRNKMIHNDYELKESDEIVIDDAYFNLMFYLISKALIALNLTSHTDESNASFIDIDYLSNELRTFLHIHLGESLGLKKFYDPFLIPLLKLLKIPIN